MRNPPDCTFNQQTSISEGSGVFALAAQSVHEYDNIMPFEQPGVRASHTYIECLDAQTKEEGKKKAPSSLVLSTWTPVNACQAFSSPAGAWPQKTRDLSPYVLLSVQAWGGGGTRARGRALTHPSPRQVSSSWEETLYMPGSPTVDVGNVRLAHPERGGGLPHALNDRPIV